MLDEPGKAARRTSPFGRLLREFRIAARLSQEALAERAQMSVAGVSMLERGLRAPRRETVAMLAAGLDLSPQERVRLQAAAAVAVRRGTASGGTAAANAAGTRKVGDRQIICSRCRTRCLQNGEVAFGADGPSGTIDVPPFAPVGSLFRLPFAVPASDMRFSQALDNVERLLGAAALFGGHVIASVTQGEGVNNGS